MVLHPRRPRPAAIIVIAPEQTPIMILAPGVARPLQPF